MKIAKSLRIFLGSQDECRPAQILWRAIMKSESRNRKSRLITQFPIGDWFAFREQAGMISYMPRGKEQGINDDGTWKREGRQSTSPGKWIRGMFKPEAIKRLKLKDDEFAMFATAVKVDEERSRREFEFVSFESGYDYKNYPSGIESCMWDEPVSEFYELLGAQCLVATDPDGKFMGRAVVWPAVSSVACGTKSTITLMDRVYADSESTRELMLEYAKSRGWHRLKRQSRDNAGELVSPDGSIAVHSLVVKSEQAICADFYPYLDTFRYGSAYSVSTAHSDYEYCYTDGKREPEEEDDDRVCDIDGEYRDEEDCVFVRGEYYPRGDDRVVELADGDYELDRLARWCEDLEEYYLRDETVSVGWRGYYPEDHEDIVEIGGTYHHREDDDICVLADGDYALVGDCIEFEDDWFEKDSRWVTEVGGEHYHVDDERIECVEGEYRLRKDEEPEGEQPEVVEIEMGHGASVRIVTVPAAEVSI